MEARVGAVMAAEEAEAAEAPAGASHRAAMSRVATLGTEE